MTVCEYNQGDVIKKNIEKRGVTNHYWSDEFLDLFREKWAEVLKEEREKDEFFARVYENIQNFREIYKYWVSLGFLPRPKPQDTGALGGKK
jgi:TRAP-type mannitol/chloroaromatic compound transport system substrate-binding protein